MTNSGSPPTPPFVGRDSELATIDSVVADLSATGTARVLEVVGEPGIGKTRLLAELPARVRAPGRVVLTGRASEPDRATTLRPFVAALDDHLAGPGGERAWNLPGPAATALAEVFPGLRTSRGGGPGATRPAAPTDAQLYRRCRTVRALLTELARPHGLVLVLDDLHLADPASIELLVHLLRHPPRAPVLLAIAYRPAQARARLAGALAAAVVEDPADHGGTGLVTRLELGPLPLPAVAELLGPAVRPDRLRRLFIDSGGNPFYLEALAGIAATAEPGARAPEAAAAEPITPARRLDRMPAHVRTALRDELAPLTRSGRLAACAAAVAGDPFDRDLVEAAAGLDGEETLAALDELLTRDLVRMDPGGRRFAYRHPLVRQVAYALADPRWRVGAHARLDLALARRNAPPAARAPHVAHTAEAGDLGAVTLLAAAADAVLAEAPATAAHWLAVARRLLPARAIPAPRHRARGRRETAPAASGRARDTGAGAPAGREAPGHALDRLTARERQIAELVARGYGNDRIAAELVVSVRTVTTHLSNIYAKLGVSSRTLLAVRVIGA